MSEASGGYYVPHGSHWPIVGTVGLTAMLVGASGYLQGGDWGMWVGFIGAAILLYMVFGWFSDVISEGVKGYYNSQVDASFRWGMIWFIFSEVMFFGAFFGALFYARTLAVPWLSGGDVATNQVLWEGVTLNWPTAGPGNTDLQFQPMGPWPLPTINTLILLTSGVTLTKAHHALKDNHRGALIGFMWVTVALGLLFMCIQAYEYYEAWTHLNLQLSTGIYGSTFYMLTGFHGMHVIIGTIMLIVIALRCMWGHFTPDGHFGFEGVAWYWHFVDVVWLGLYVFVYIL